MKCQPHQHDRLPVQLLRRHSPSGQRNWVKGCLAGCPSQDGVPTQMLKGLPAARGEGSAWKHSSEVACVYGKLQFVGLLKYLDDDVCDEFD